MSYIDELRAQWEKNKNLEVQLTLPRPLERSPSLRGRDFWNELVRLHALTGDERFSAVCDALVEHKIIDRRCNFTRWDPPVITNHEKQSNQLKVEIIAKYVGAGASVRCACAMVAASGHNAATFEAAMKDLEKLYRETLDQKCSTIIPLENMSDRARLSRIRPEHSGEPGSTKNVDGSTLAPTPSSRRNRSAARNALRQDSRG